MNTEDDAIRPGGAEVKAAVESQPVVAFNRDLFGGIQAFDAGDLSIRFLKIKDRRARAGQNEFDELSKLLVIFGEAGKGFHGCKSPCQ